MSSANFANNVAIAASPEDFEEFGVGMGYLVD